MSWQRRFTDKAGDILRFVGYAFLAFDAIVLSLFSFWFVSKFAYNLAVWLDRILFARWN